MIQKISKLRGFDPIEILKKETIDACTDEYHDDHLRFNLNALGLETIYGDFRSPVETFA